CLFSSKLLRTNPLSITFVFEASVFLVQGFWSNEKISTNRDLPSIHELDVGVMTTESPSFNPCLTSIPVSVVKPQTTLTRRTIPSRTVQTYASPSSCLTALLGTLITGSSFPGDLISKKLTLTLISGLMI